MSTPTQELFETLSGIDEAGLEELMGSTSTVERQDSDMPADVLAATDVDPANMVMFHGPAAMAFLPTCAAKQRHEAAPGQDVACRFNRAQPPVTARAEFSPRELNHCSKQSSTLYLYDPAWNKVVHKIDKDSVKALFSHLRQRAPLRQLVDGVDEEHFFQSCARTLDRFQRPVYRQCSVLDFLCDDSVHKKHRLLRLEHLGMAMPCPKGMDAKKTWKSGNISCGSVCFLAAYEQDIAEQVLTKSATGQVKKAGLSKFLADALPGTGDLYYKNAMRDFNKFYQDYDGYAPMPPLDDVPTEPQQLVDPSLLGEAQQGRHSMHVPRDADDLTVESQSPEQPAASPFSPDSQHEPAPGLPAVFLSHPPLQPCCQQAWHEGRISGWQDGWQAGVEWALQQAPQMLPDLLSQLNSPAAVPLMPAASSPTPALSPVADMVQLQQLAPAELSYGWQGLPAGLEPISLNAHMANLTVCDGQGAAAESTTMPSPHPSTPYQATPPPPGMPCASADQQAPETLGGVQ